jgi:hypothetical protein
VGADELARDLLQRIADPALSQDQAAGIIEQLHQGFLQRFAEPAIAPLALLDTLLALPERNDDLLRTLAARLQPWRTDPPPLLTQVEPAQDVAHGVLQSDVSHNDISDNDVVQSNVSQNNVAHNDAATQSESNRNELDRVAPLPPVAEAQVGSNVVARQPLPHGYDERRFGSQQALLELLQRQRDSGKSAMSLIEIILS